MVESRSRSPISRFASDATLAPYAVIRLRSIHSTQQTLREHRQPDPLSYRSCYAGFVADTITFRPDEDTQRALDVLTADGTAVSTVVRSALIDAARARARARLRSEAEVLAADPADRAEAAQVLRDMETLRAW